MQKSEMHKRVLEMISIDRDNPTYMKTLKSQTGLSRRRITDIIRELRVYYPICSTKIAPGGYWIGQGNDVRYLIADMRSTANTLLNTANNLNSFLESGDFISGSF